MAPAPTDVPAEAWQPSCRPYLTPKQRRNLRRGLRLVGEDQAGDVADAFAVRDEDNIGGAERRGYLKREEHREGLSENRAVIQPFSHSPFCFTTKAAAHEEAPSKPELRSAPPSVAT